MQIFVTSPCPDESARRLWLNPNRARKMITEYQQILACVQEEQDHRVRMKKVSGEPFRTPLSRMNHPVVRWARSDEKHAQWLVRSLWTLHGRYEGQGFTNVLDNIGIFLSQAEETGWGDITFLNFAKANDKGLDFTHVGNVFHAYHLFLKAQGG